jgi:hypothetical protein
VPDEGTQRLSYVRLTQAQDVVLGIPAGSNRSAVTMAILPRRDARNRAAHGCCGARRYRDQSGVSAVSSLFLSSAAYITNTSGYDFRKRSDRHSAPSYREHPENANIRAK